MILGRRDPPGFLRRLAGWLWPRAGWRRAGSYLLMRIKRLPGTPRAIAAGLATGVAVGLTPFVGLHLPLALALAWLTGGNLLAAGLGTLVSNPWTLPLIWASTYRLGCLLLGRAPHGLHLLADLRPRILLGEAGLLLWPMSVGAVPLPAGSRPRGPPLVLPMLPPVIIPRPPPWRSRSCPVLSRSVSARRIPILWRSYPPRAPGRGRVCQHSQNN